MIRKATVILLTAILIGGCGHGAPRKAEQPAAPSREGGSAAPQVIRLSPEARENIGLKAVAMSRGPIRENLVTTAVIKPDEYHMAHVSPRIPGKAVEVFAKLGDTVKKGQVLAELDSLELGEKKAAFLRARTNLQVAERNYQREKGLFAKQVSSEKDYLEAKGEYERSQAAYQEARQALQLLDISDAAIGQLNWADNRSRLSLFPLLSPFAGTVVDRHMTIGEQIRPDETVFTVLDLSTVWILVDVYEKDLGRVTLGDTVRVTVDAYPGEVFEGRIAYVSNVLDSQTRTARARVEVSNSDRRLRPGMFATASIALKPASSVTAIVVPNDAVQQVEGGPVVFVEENAGTYRAARVKLGATGTKETQVLRGLSPGEWVVTTGSFYLKSALLKESIGESD